MGKNNVKPKEIREGNRQKFLDGLRYSEPKETLAEPDLEYVKIASTHPLDFSEFISQANHGIQFKDLQQRDRFLYLVRKYEEYVSMCMSITDLRGDDLRLFAINKMLNDPECKLSYANRMVLKSQLPKEIER